MEERNQHQNQYFVFRIDKQRYAIMLSVVEKVVRAVELITLPECPETLLGLIDMGGRIIPVIDIRKIFKLPVRGIELNDRVIICEAPLRSAAFIVDEVEGVFDFSESITAGEIYPEMERFIDGVGRIGNDSVIIYNIDRLFFAEQIEGDYKV